MSPPDKIYPHDRISPRVEHEEHEDNDQNEEDKENYEN